MSTETGDRPVDARLVVDLTPLAGAAVVAAAAIAVAAAIVVVAARRPPAIGAVTMGPGGWVSVKRAGCPPLRDASPRPWWARLLGAHRLVVKSRS